MMMIIIIIIIIIINFAACPADWMVGSSSSRCHKVLSQASQFSDVIKARQLCIREGADLATISDVNEEELISQLIAGLVRPFVCVCVWEKYGVFVCVPVRVCICAYECSSLLHVCVCMCVCVCVSLFCCNPLN